MIVKVLTRHNPSYGSLIDYILKESKSKDREPQVFTHNVRSDNPKQWEQEFAENESFRLHNRSDKVMLYHEILSFSSNENTKAISKEVLEDIAGKYIELRGRDGMMIGATHHDKDHVHIHFMSSGVGFRTGKAYRISRPKLQQLKVELQKYHRERYPELTKSNCEHGANKPYYNQKEYQAIKRDERSLHKGSITKEVQQCFVKSHSQEDFFTRLQEAGLHYYERKGQPQGIIASDGMKFRFSRLGISQQQIKSLSQIKSINHNLIMKEKVKLNQTQQPNLNERLNELDQDTQTNHENSIEREELIEGYQTYMHMEIDDLQNKLDDVYEQKNDIFRQFEMDDFGIWDEEAKERFHNLTMKESSLISKIEELQLSMEADKTNSKESHEMNNLLDEMQSLRDGNNMQEIDLSSDHSDLLVDLDSLDAQNEMELDNQEQELMNEFEDLRNGDDIEMEIDDDIDLGDDYE